MQKAIEIKYGQDNDNLIQEAILTGLPWNGLTEERVMEFFHGLLVYTKRSDYRFIDRHFKIMGSYYPVGPVGTVLPEQFRVYEVAFRRAKSKVDGLPEDCVAFEAYIYESDNVKRERVMPVFHQVYHEGSGLCSAAVISDFSLQFLREVSKGDRYDMYNVHNFSFGGHGTDVKYVWHQDGVQP